MLTFTVHEPPNAPPDRIDRAESLVFIKDGFGWVAALFAPIWLLVHRLWWPLLGFIVLSGGFELIKRVTGVDQRWVGLAMLALNLLIGFEADTLRRWALERRGWTRRFEGPRTVVLAKALLDGYTALIKTEKDKEETLDQKRSALRM